jgi:internalin A
LDLGQLGLTELPAELFGLKHLRRLNLGSGMFGEHEQGEWVEACSQIAPNQLDATLADLSRLPGLSALSVRGAILTSLNGIQSLSTLQSLVCSRTQISDLSPLAELRQLQVLICSRTNVNDLAPLKELQRLQELNCARTPVASLAPRHLLGRQTCGYSAVHGRLLVILPRYPNRRILKNFTAKEPR